MTEIMVTVMEWQSPALLLVLVTTLIVLKLANATPKWYGVSFFALVGSFALLLLAEVIFICSM